MFETIKKLFHTCGYFGWQREYGLTPWGMGSYDVQYCKECQKPTGKYANFTRDEELYKQ